MFVRTDKCKVVNLYYNKDSFYSRLVDLYVYSSIIRGISETHYLQDIIDEIFLKSTLIWITL